MRSKSIMLILIAAVCGTVAATGVSQALKSPGDGAAPVLETASIFVAAKEVDIREAFSAENVRLEDWPKGKIPEGAITDLAQIEGQYARTRLYEGEVILQKKLMNKNDVGSHEVTIPPGYRVKSVQVSMESAVSNLVMPGSRVDVLVFLKQGGDIPRTGAYTILKNVRVFAVNERVDRDIDHEGQPMNARTVSLLVKPDQVEKLLVAGAVGRLELSLRRPDDATDEDRITDDMTALADLLRSRNKSGVDEEKGTNAKPAPAVASAAAGSFAEFLSHARPPAPAVPPALEPAATYATMVVMTPDGATRFRWTDPAAPPEEVPGGTMAAPALPKPAAGGQTPAAASPGASLPGQSKQPIETPE